MIVEMRYWKGIPFLDLGNRFGMMVYLLAGVVETLIRRWKMGVEARVKAISDVRRNSDFSEFFIKKYGFDGHEEMLCWVVDFLKSTKHSDFLSLGEDCPPCFRDQYYEALVESALSLHELEHLCLSVNLNPFYQNRVLAKWLAVSADVFYHDEKVVVLENHIHPFLRDVFRKSSRLG